MCKTPSWRLELRPLPLTNIYTCRVTTAPRVRSGKKNLKLIIFKILSMTFIIAILLLSHINETFQPSSIQLYLNESFSKHKSYEYTNVIFRTIIHFFF